MFDCTETRGSWSKRGTYARRFQNEPTMTLNLKPRNCEGRKPTNYKYIIRHEFGHALGLTHEHQREDAPPMYIKEDLIKFLLNEGICSRESVEGCIERSWARITRRAKSWLGKYDKHSVMHYCIPEEARADSYGGPKTEHKKLSKIDRETIVELYSKLEG